MELDSPRETGEETALVDRDPHRRLRVDVERHNKIHSAKYDCYKGESRKRKLEFLKSARSKHTTCLTL